MEVYFMKSKFILSNQNLFIKSKFFLKKSKFIYSAKIYFFQSKFIPWITSLIYLIKVNFSNQSLFFKSKFNVKSTRITIETWHAQIQHKRKRNQVFFIKFKYTFNRQFYSFWMVRIVKFRLGKYIENFWSSQLLLTCSENNSNNNNKNKN